MRNEPSGNLMLNKMSTDETRQQINSVTRLMNAAAAGESGMMGEQFHSFRSPQNNNQHMVKVDRNLNNQKYLGAYHTGVDNLHLSIAKDQYFMQSSYNNSTSAEDYLKKDSKGYANLSHINQQSGIFLSKGPSGGKCNHLTYFR